MHNSIADNINPATTISLLSLKLGEDVYTDKTFIVVEGIKDVKLMQKLVVYDKVSIIQSYGGEKLLEKICERYANKDARVIGIRDKDYRKEPSQQNIFFYDHCNLKMMIVGNNQAFRSFCSEYFIGHYDFFEIRMCLLKNLELLSIFRKENYELDKDMCFKGISFKDLWKPDIKKLDKKELLRQIKNRNRSFIADNRNMIVSCLKKVRESTFDYTDLLNTTNGHDFCALLNVTCVETTKENRAEMKAFKCVHDTPRPNIELRSISFEEVESALHCSFSNECFKTTVLYRALKQYGDIHGLEIVS